MFLLRVSMLGNGIFSSAAGLTMMLIGPSLAGYLEVPTSLVYVVGAGVVLFGLLLLWTVWRGEPDHGFTLAVIGADMVWVLAAVVVLAIPGTMSNKWLFATVSGVVMVFGVLQMRGLVESSRTNPRHLVTTVEIAAEPARVWEELTDFESYQRWNPFMVEASGDLALGKMLRVRMRPPGGSAMTFTPTVTTVDPEVRFEWLGNLWISGLFEGRHQFALQSTANGTTMRHSEEFSGLLVPLLWKSLDSRTRAGFDAMNQALKRRVEDSLQHSP